MPRVGHVKACEVALGPDAKRPGLARVHRPERLTDGTFTSIYSTARPLRSITHLSFQSMRLQRTERPHGCGGSQTDD